MLFPVVEVTRLLSNLIKYPFVDLRGKETRVINYEKEDKFVPFDKNKKVVVKTVEEVEKEKKARASEQAAEQDLEVADFEAGVPVVNYDEILEEKKKQAESEAQEYLEKARQQADAILADAEQQSEQIREMARQEGVSTGHEEGMKQGMQEVELMREKVETERENQKREYEQLLHNTEGRYVDILCQLLRKLTGVIVEDRKEVILHLIRSGFSDIEPAKKYIVRVSADDLLYVESKKEDIIEKTGIDGVIEIQEEKGFAKGECMIETDTQMIDCGFHTQLENMISTLRMLV